MFLQGIGCFKVTFLMQVIDGAKPYQTSLKCMVKALQQLLKDELDQLQRQQIIVSLCVDETSGWCQSFDLVPKFKREVWLCLDPARLNQAPIRPVHRCHSTNNIFPKLTYKLYPALIDGSSGYYNLK